MVVTIVLLQAVHYTMTPRTRERNDFFCFSRSIIYVPISLFNHYVQLFDCQILSTYQCIVSPPSTPPWLQWGYSGGFNMQVSPHHGVFDKQCHPTMGNLTKSCIKYIKFFMSNPHHMPGASMGLHGDSPHLSWDI